MRMRTAASVGLGLLMSFAAVAHAQTQTLGEMIANAVTAQTSGIGDAIVARDQAMWEQLGLSARFNIPFRPHEAVCADAVAGAAHCNARVVSDFGSILPARRGGVSPNAVPPPPAGAYGPAQFLSAYGLSGQSAASAPPVIAIVDAYDNPTIQNDLAAYSSAYGIPSLPACSGAIANSPVACFQKVNQNGSTASFPVANAGWALEIALDVEAAHAVCQNCSILLVEASSNSFGNLLTAEDRAVALGANVVSNSWGASEFSSESFYDSHFNHPGVAFTVSAGDSGYGTEYPASSPYVTAVGGTSLFLNSDNSYNSEVAWSGTGSGCSAYEGKPAWQSDPGCTKRTVADVSADADPNTGAAVYDTYGYGGHAGWFQVGGTSLASPLIAAVYAQAGTQSGVQENSLPYAQGATTALHDVATGSNGSCTVPYLCTAEAGYDGPTGLGSPLGLDAFGTGTGGGTPPPPPPPSPPPAQSFTLAASPTLLAVSRGHSGSDTITVVPAGGFTGSVTLSVSGLPSGVTVRFSKNPTTSSSVLRLSVNRRTATGAYTVTVSGTSGPLSAATSFTLQVQ